MKYLGRDVSFIVQLCDHSDGSPARMVHGKHALKSAPLSALSSG